MSTRLFLFLLFTAFAHAQPPFAPFGVAVRNAATPNTSVVAPGSLIAITPLAPELQSLEGVTAELLVATDDVRPLPLLPAPNGVGAWAFIPKDVTSNPFVTLIRNGVRYTAALFIQPIVPSLFASDYSGFGPAAATSYGGANPARNALTSAAVPERFVSLYATGLNDARAADVIVDVAGQTVPAVYAGPQGTPGVDQINFIVPKNAYLGCYVPVTIRVRGVVSNSVTLSINSDPFACAHPLGLTYADMKTLDAGGFVPMANLSIFSSQTDDQPLSEGALLQTISADASTVALYSGTQLPDSLYVTCTTSNVNRAARGGVFQFGDPGPITLTGPNGQQTMVTLPAAGITSHPFFTPGQWHLRADAANSFLPFDRTFTLPPAISSINIAPRSVLSSERDFEVIWNPAGFGANDLISVTGPSGSCITRAWTGHITFPKPSRALLSGVQVSVFPHWAGRPQFDLPGRDGRVVRTLVNYSFTLTETVVVE